MEEIDGQRQIAAPQSAAEIKAGKRPVMVDNPDCTIPLDAIEITAEKHAALFDAQAAGKQIATRGKKAIAIERPVDVDARAAAIKLERNQKLAASDWTQLPDAALEPEVKAEWAAYRQALRDLEPGSSEFPESPRLSPTQIEQ